MKYQPSLPEHNDNVDEAHPLKDFLKILVGLAVALLLGFFLLGLLVDAVVDRMSPDAEEALTRVIARHVPAAPAQADPRAAQLQQLVDSLRACAGLRGPATVRLQPSAVPNAVVFPGGTIYVHAGLLDRVTSENGLAFVLAHELAHLSQRDHLRALGRGLVLYTLVTLVTGDGSALAGALAPVQQLGEANYSQGREAAADLAALKTLACRYGHVGGATEFFEALQTTDEDAIPGSHYFASHPAMRARIEALRLAAAQAGMRQQPVRPFVAAK